MKNLIIFGFVTALLIIPGCNGWTTKTRDWIEGRKRPVNIEAGLEEGQEHAVDNPHSAKNPVVEIATNYGNIKLELFENHAPETVDNFLEYVNSKSYDKTLMHRVRPKFMIQGGGYNYKYEEIDTRLPVKNEASNGLKNKRYTIAMARTGKPHSATSQFFINHNDNFVLDFKRFSDKDYGYCVFGEVIKGRETVDKIAAVKCRTGNLHPGEISEPIKPVKIFWIRRIK